MDHLLKEAWKLRFTDADREKRFDVARLTNATLRVRTTLAVGLVVMGGMGLIGFWNPKSGPEDQMLAWFIRYGMCVPLWLLFFLSTWSRYFTQRMDQWLSPGIPVTCALFTWESITLAYLPENTQVPVLLGVNVLPILMVSALAIPFRFRWLLSAVILSVSLPTAMVAFWQPKLALTDLAFGALNLAGFGVCILIAGWWREAMERRLFAQREHVDHANEELKRLNEQKNAFLAMAAHDLRAPLSSNRAMAEILLMEPEPSTEERRDMMADIAATTDRMLELVTNFLDVHALDTGKLPVHLESLDLGAAAAGSARRHLLVAQRKQQHISMELESDVNPVRADASLLNQILDNLLSNALKFSPSAATIRVRVRRNGDREHAVEIQDAGPGFRKDDFNRAFRAFTRLSALPTGGEESLGLGLSLCKRFVDAMGGKIELRNNGEDGGATVAVFLPSA